MATITELRERAALYDKFCHAVFATPEQLEGPMPTITQNEVRNLEARVEKLTWCIWRLLFIILACVAMILALAFGVP